MKELDTTRLIATLNDKLLLQLDFARRIANGKYGQYAGSPESLSALEAIDDLEAYIKEYRSGIE